VTALAREYVLPLLIGVAGWIVTNFLASPILALQGKRREALEVAERYYRVDSASSDDLRDRALKSLNDVGNALRALSREASLATRLWCKLCGYDLDFAARCLFGLAAGPRGEFAIEARDKEKTLNAFFVSLGAARHLSPEAIKGVRRDIEKARNGQDGRLGRADD
jgi:hypothetical protein